MRIALLWELGGGLGHASQLKPIAAELVRRGHEATLVLRDLVLTDVVLHGTPYPRLQAPVWTHRVVGAPDPQVSMAEILLGAGYLDASSLRGLVTGWIDTLRAVRADAVLCDYAPTGALAARVLGIPAANTGLSFFMPPDVAPMPAFRDWEPLPPGRVEHAETRALASVNGVLAQLGAPALDRLSLLFQGDRALLGTWRELDGHASHRPADQRYYGPSLGEPAGMTPEWPAGDGPRAFVYVRGNHPDLGAVLQALDRGGVRTLCYVPEIVGGQAPPVVSPRVAYARGPVNLPEAFRQSDIAVSNGGASTGAQALLDGVPLLLLPVQAEQFIAARELERHGLGLNAAQRRRPTDFDALVRELLDDPRRRARVAAFAEAHAGHTQALLTSALADAVESLAR